MTEIKQKMKKKQKSKMKFDEVSHEWLQFKQSSIKESTYYNYKFIIEKYLNPHFYGQDIEEIASFNEFVQSALKSLSTKTVKDIICLLKAILKYYEEEYKCHLEYKKIGTPKTEKKHIKILSDKEKEKLEAYCLQENSLKAIGILICLNTGMRIGEICALRWENIDLESRTIYVIQTLQRTYNCEQKISKILIDNPKTENSIRGIPINKKLYTVLKNMKKNYAKEAFFLTGEKDKYIEPRNYQRAFKKILKRSQLKPYVFHILRHTFATNCIDVGMDIKSLSEVLGHATVEITLNRYVHSSEKIKKKYLEKL